MYPAGVQISQVGGVPLDPCQAQTLETLEGQERVTSWPYYSTVKFVAPQVGVGPFTYDLAAGVEARAYSYGVGDPRIPAGYTNADGPATIADTNLTQRNQTTGGQNVLVHGIAFQWLPCGFHLNDGQAVPHRIRPLDWHFVSALHESVSCELVLNGDENTFRLGTIGMIPGAGGLQGGTRTEILDQRFAGSQRDLAFPTNGWPTRSNFFRVPEGLIWRNQSNADSMLNIRFRTTRAIRLFSGGSPETNIANVAFANAAGAESTGVNQQFPTELVAELKVFLVGSVVGPRTRSA